MVLALGGTQIGRHDSTTRVVEGEVWNELANAITAAVVGGVDAQVCHVNRWKRQLAIEIRAGRVAGKIVVAAVRVAAQVLSRWR